MRFAHFGAAWWALLVAAVGLAAPSEASAQDSPAVDSKGADPKNAEEAKMHFTAGVALLRDPGKPRYEEAYREFKSAYALSRNPKVLGNIAFCAMKLERDAEAIESYEQYIRDVPALDAADKSQIERDLLTLRTGIAKITVDSKPAGATLIDMRVPVHGDAITNFYGTLKGPTALTLRRGHHVLRARLEGREDRVWEVDLDAAELPPHTFEFPDVVKPVAQAPAPVAPVPAAPREQSVERRPLTTPVYVAGGVTLALGVASAITGVLASGNKSDFDAMNDGSDPAAARRARDTGQTLNVTADALLVGAALGAIATAYFIVTRPTQVERTTVQARGDGMAVHFRF